MEQTTQTHSWDSHTTAMLFGIVLNEFFSYIAFDVRLVKAIVRQRSLKPMPCAYLFARYSMVFGVTMVAEATARSYTGRQVNVRVVHWIRAIMLPFSLTATSAILGFRAVVLHHDRHRCITMIIYLLLAAELTGGLMVLCLAMYKVDEPDEYMTESLPGVWVVAPLGISMLIDTVVCMFVALPILYGHELPKAGEVRHLLLSDALFFGVISFLAKTLAISLSLASKCRLLDRFVVIRLQIVVCTIFACRIFRGQEIFLRVHQDQAANPHLEDYIRASASVRTAQMQAPADLEDEEEDYDDTLPAAGRCRRQHDSVSDYGQCCPSALRHEAPS